jgi:hypothetical protein
MAKNELGNKFTLWKKEVRFKKSGLNKSKPIQVCNLCGCGGPRD